MGPSWPDSSETLDHPLEVRAVANGSTAVDVAATAAAVAVDASTKLSRENICPYLHRFHNCRHYAYYRCTSQTRIPRVITHCTNLTVPLRYHTSKTVPVVVALSLRLGAEDVCITVVYWSRVAFSFPL